MHRWRALGRAPCSENARWVTCRPFRPLTINHRVSKDVPGDSANSRTGSESTEVEPAKVALSSRPSFKKRSEKAISQLPLHTSKASFLTYAAQTDLSPESTVFRGTKYEYTCLEALSRLGFELTRIGGRGDAGIDLIGSWSLPAFPVPLQALVQCKFHAGQVVPAFVRELEGAFSARSIDGDKTTVAVLCTPKLPTKGMREALRRCTRPAVLSSIDENGWINAIIWNDAVKDICGEIGVGLRYVGTRKEAFLQIGDQPWVFDSDDRNHNEG